MKTGLYMRLALDGMRKNKRLYLPYLLACTGMVTMYYILRFLAGCRALAGLPGEQAIRTTLGLGGAILGLFSYLFLFYTNAFLIRRRKKEFGLYGMLGMDRRSLGRILAWETLFAFLLSVGAGLCVGVLLSHLAELGLARIAGGAASGFLSVAPGALRLTFASFAVLFLLLFLNGWRQVRFQSVVSLLQSESAGEKPPKANYLLGALGIALLLVAYYLAGSIRNPLSAINLFFVAVLLVIAGTYLTLISSSVALCRLLKKSRRYYARVTRFVSVSSMAWRMKRNGAGLAAVCILATMVLVTVSSTASLYFGTENALAARFPREISLELTLDADAAGDEAADKLLEETEREVRRAGFEPQGLSAFRGASITGLLSTGVVRTDPFSVNAPALQYDNLYSFILLPLRDYNAMTGEAATLAPGEALLCYRTADFPNGVPLENGRLCFQSETGPRFSVREQRAELPAGLNTKGVPVATLLLVVPDFGAGLQGLETLADASGDRLFEPGWSCQFDIRAGQEAQAALCDRLAAHFSDEAHITSGVTACNTESRDENRASFYGIYGGLFYLGVLLSIVFLCAAVLILYYKQISEGYEDQPRFAIMQNVGMTKREIRACINRQLLTVFFLPLLLATLHLAFAFPIIRKLLLLFNYDNAPFFAAVTALCVVVFALVYGVVYRITSNAYYHIVSDAKEQP